jgi:hypothetical protein
VLDLHRVAADNEVPEVVVAGHRRARFPLQRGLAPADDSLVGFQLHEDVRTVGAGDLLIESDAEHLHVGDPQLRADVLEHI